MESLCWAHGRLQRAPDFGHLVWNESLKSRKYIIDISQALSGDFLLDIKLHFQLLKSIAEHSPFSNFFA